jgi:multicomponent Na+:H+ antiporter subunit E
MKLEGSGEQDSHRRRGGHRVANDKSDQHRERSMSGAMDVSSGLLRRGLARTAGFLAFWLILARFDPVTFLVGALAAVIATRISLHLLPPGLSRFRPVALAGFVLRFLGQSIGAGVDVAWRALDPRLPIRPGFVVYETRLPPGAMRNAFCTITSLLPGTLPSGSDESGAVVVHCLDITQPVAEQLAREEALLEHALGRTLGNG